MRGHLQHAIQTTEELLNEPWDSVPNFVGQHPLVGVSRHLLLICFIIMPMSALLMALFCPIWNGASGNAEADASSGGKGPTMRMSEARDAAPDIIVKKDTDGAGAPPVSAPLHAADDQLPEEHLSLLFERIATSHPSKTAIRAIDGSLSLTRGDLHASARHGATALRDAGIESGSLVGLMVSCSVEGCIGVLSIVLAGGAYVPLDPSSPPHRLTEIIAAAQLTRVLTATSSRAPSAKAQKDAAGWLRSAWPGVVSTLEISVHRERETHTGDATPLISTDDELRSLHRTGTDKTLVAVLFTSGSTGRPKGVPSYEAGVLAGARFFTDAFPYAESEVVLHHIPYGWVDHKMELWHALLRGKEILVVPDTAALLTMVDSPPRDVEKLWAVPTLLDALFQAVEARGERATASFEPPAFLQLVVATGEALTPPMVARYRKLVPTGTIVSSYGLTETQGETSVAVYAPSRAVHGNVSIGSPHAPYGYGIRALETGEWLTGAGGTHQMGELYVAGPLILEGYYRRADGVCLADEDANARFSPAAPEVWPALSRGSRAGARTTRCNMYQTGDLVMWRDDGEVQHLGRVDDQVKVGGVRVELGHVASAALKCPGVADARAAAARDANGSTRIVVFVTGRSGAGGVSSSKLMSNLAEQLPSSQMPSACVCLPDGLPLLPNGKVDRKQLGALAAEALLELALEGEGPVDSLSRIVSGAGSSAPLLPGWHFVCMHFVCLAMFSMLVAHIGFFGWYFWQQDGKAPGSHKWVHWVGVGVDISHAMLLAFFASGYMDLVGLPPRSFRAGCKRLGAVLAFYLAWQPIAALLKIGSVANLWPVALLLLFRCVAWPLRALMVSKLGASALVVAGTLAFISILLASVCRPWDGAPMCAGPLGQRFLDSLDGKMAVAPLFRSMVQDARMLIAWNSGIALFPAYAAFPPLVHYCLGDCAWKIEAAPEQPPSFANRRPSFLTMARLRFFLSKPRIYRRFMAALYVIMYQFVIVNLFAINPGPGNLATKSTANRNGLNGILFYWFFATIQGLLCAALFVLLPNRATPFSAMGSCALASYLTYLGFIEPDALSIMGDSLRFVNAPYRPHLEVFCLGLLALVALVAGSFSFGLSLPITLPSWASKASSLCGLLPASTTVRVPIVNFPAGKSAFCLSWFILLAIPNVLTVPSEMRDIVGPSKIERHLDDNRNTGRGRSPLDTRVAALQPGIRTSFERLAKGWDETLAEMHAKRAAAGGGDG